MSYGEGWGGVGRASGTFVGDPPPDLGRGCCYVPTDTFGHPSLRMPHCLLLSAD